jgi:hypothetical protein
MNQDIELQFLMVCIKNSSHIARKYLKKKIVPDVGFTQESMDIINTLVMDKDDSNILSDYAKRSIMRDADSTNKAALLNEIKRRLGNPLQNFRVSAMAMGYYLYTCIMIGYIDPAKLSLEELESVDIICGSDAMLQILNKGNIVTYVPKDVKPNLSQVLRSAGMEYDPIMFYIGLCAELLQELDDIPRSLVRKVVNKVENIRSNLKQLEEHFGGRTNVERVRIFTAFYKEIGSLFDDIISTRF